MFELFDFMPTQASEWAARVDWINNWISVVSAICIVGLTLLMLYFAVKYRRRSDNQKTAYVTHNGVLEFVWTAVPTIICIYVFYEGYVVYKEMRTPPASSLEINVDAYKWRWEFTYSNGKKATKDLVVPLGRPVRLIMTSHDVIHSLFIPAMRVKEDVYHGNYSYLWFTPTKLGNYHIFCTEYCGLNHSQMTGTLKVVTPEEFEDYLIDRSEGSAPELPPAELGKQLFTLKGCNACHSLDGSKIVGPSLRAFFNSGERLCEDGSTVKADEDYFRQSVMNPNSKIVKGYAPMMPSFEGQLKEKEIQALIAYLKTL